MASSSSRRTAICVIGCTTNLGRDEEFQKAAKELGKCLSKRRINLVYEGSIQGLSGMVAMTCIIRGSDVLGVTLLNPNNPIEGKFSLGTTHRASNPIERLQCMLLNCDAFIALPGGAPTLELISSIIWWANENYHRKPIGFLNVSGFFNNFLSFINHAASQGFIPEHTRRLIRSTPNADQLIDQLLNPAPAPTPVPVPVIRNDNSDPDTDLRLTLPAYRLS